MRGLIRSTRRPRPWCTTLIFRGTRLARGRTRCEVTNWKGSALRLPRSVRRTRLRGSRLCGHWFGRNWSDSACGSLPCEWPGLPAIATGGVTQEGHDLSCPYGSDQEAKFTATLRVARATRRDEISPQRTPFGPGEARGAHKTRFAQGRQRALRSEKRREDPPFVESAKGRPPTNFGDAGTGRALRWDSGQASPAPTTET